MSTPGYVEATLARARGAGASPTRLRALRTRLERLADPSAGLLPGSDLEPVDEPTRLEDLPEPDPATASQVLDRVAVIKVNGGLGTSMGLTGPKSVLEVKPGHSFLSILARQILAARQHHGVRLPLLLMNTTETRQRSLDALRRIPGLDEQALPLDFLQGREPRLRADDWLPIDWPADPRLQWCPPGHGDLYTALAASGMLAELLDAGIRWAFVSNADNLGAVVDPRPPAWMAAERVPFLLETVRGTSADRKGGHLARHRGRTVLRETAQVPPDDTSFTDVTRWRHYNSNNLWLDLEALQQLQAADPGAPHLPLIVNHKRVDPTDPSSPAVIQLESAMGAAIGSFPGARAITVPRTRFAPVKTTSDLLVVRSDAYRLDARGHLLPTYSGSGPVVTLDPDHYGHIDDLDRYFPQGVPSLRECDSLRVDGPVTFGRDVVVTGTAHLSGPADIPDGQTVGTPTHPDDPHGADPGGGAAALFARVFDGARPDGCWWAPGRVNLIGEHTDYNDGFVLPLALGLGVQAAVRVRPDRLLRVHSRGAGPTQTVHLDAVAAGTVPGWLGYLAGVGWALRQQGHDVPGLDVAITSTVPIGAGLSSSAALACAVALAWNDVAGLRLDRTTLAALARRAENEIVGVPTGVMDQMACLHGRRGSLMHLDTRSMQIEQVPCDLAAHGLTLLVIDSRAPHDLVDGEYAERRSACFRGATRLGVPALRDVEMSGLDDALGRLDDEVTRRRVRHVVTENDRVERVVNALRSGHDPRSIGPILTASHHSMRDDFQITVPQVDLAVEVALSAGAHGARMTGGGFGGCVLALVETDDVAVTQQAVAQAYAEHGFAAPVFFVARPSDGAHRMTVGY